MVSSVAKILQSSQIFSLQFIVCSHVGCQMRKQYSRALLSCVPGQPLMAEKTKSTFLDIFFILNMTWHHTDRSWSVWRLCYFLVLSCATVIEQHQPCPHCPRYSQPGSVSDACCIWGTEHVLCLHSVPAACRVLSRPSNIRPGEVPFIIPALWERSDFSRVPLRDSPKSYCRIPSLRS